MMQSAQRLIVMTTLAMAVCAFAQTQPTTSPATKTFKSYPYKFTIDLPATWHDHKPQPTGTILAIEPAGPKSAVVMEIQIKGNGKFKPEQIDELIGAMKDQVKTNDAKAEIEDAKDTMLGEVPAKKLSYVTTISEMKLKFVHVVTIKNGRAYVVEMFAPTDKFDNFAADFDAAVESFTFTTP